MKDLKIYSIKFKPLYPVPSGLIILAKDEEEALSIAKEVIDHTEPISANLIDSSEPSVVFYESGDY